MIVAYSIFAGILVVSYVSAYVLRSKKAIKTTEGIDPTQVSVIIPFRDEAQHLPALLQHLAALDPKPREIILVNDHSSDAGLQLCAAYASGCTILSLPENKQGKKQALQHGINQATGNWILTWDADITMEKNYFAALAQLPAADLVILPVEMQADTLPGKFAALDYLYLPMLQAGFSGFGFYFSASGANLLVRKSRFEEYAKQTLQTTASGDDQFLLGYATKNKWNIRSDYRKTLTVATETPATFQAFLQQRVRWIRKTSRVGDWAANLFALAGLVYHLLPWIVFLLWGNWYLLAMKAVADLIVSGISARHYSHFPYTAIPVFLLIYPLYMLCMLLLAPFYTLQWKGRNIRA